MSDCYAHNGVLSYRGREIELDHSEDGWSVVRAQQKIDRQIAEEFDYYMRENYPMVCLQESLARLDAIDRVLKQMKAEGKIK